MARKPKHEVKVEAPMFLGRLRPDTQISSHNRFDERDRPNSFVMSAADGEYGHVDGFRYGITQTGGRHRLSSLGRRVRDHDDGD